MLDPLPNQPVRQGRERSDPFLCASMPIFLFFRRAVSATVTVRFFLRCLAVITTMPRSYFLASHAWKSPCFNASKVGCYCIVRISIVEAVLCDKSCVYQYSIFHRLASRLRATNLFPKLSVMYIRGNIWFSEQDDAV